MTAPDDLRDVLRGLLVVRLGVGGGLDGGIRTE
jgi:hypothetical protein